MKDYPYLFLNQIQAQPMMVILRTLEKNQMKTAMKVKKKKKK